MEALGPSVRGVSHSLRGAVGAGQQTAEHRPELGHERRAPPRHDVDARDSHGGYRLGRDVPGLVLVVRGIVRVAHRPERLLRRRVGDVVGSRAGTPRAHLGHHRAHQLTHRPARFAHGGDARGWKVEVPGREPRRRRRRPVVEPGPRAPATLGRHGGLLDERG